MTTLLRVETRVREKRLLCALAEKSIDACGGRELILWDEAADQIDELWRETSGW